MLTYEPVGKDPSWGGGTSREWCRGRVGCGVSAPRTGRSLRWLFILRHAGSLEKVPDSLAGRPPRSFQDPSANVDPTHLRCPGGRSDRAGVPS